MGFIQAAMKLFGLLLFAIVSVGAFLLTMVVGAVSLMIMVGGAVLALITFGVLDYRKNKKATVPNPQDEL